MADSDGLRAAAGGDAGEGGHAGPVGARQLHAHHQLVRDVGEVPGDGGERGWHSVAAHHGM